MIFLSYILDEQTPTYGNRNKFEIIKKSDMTKGDIANDSHISTTVHVGTHIDMPYHFYEDGKTVEDYDADFWVFKNPLILEIVQEEIIIHEKLIEKLQQIKDEKFDILIVKTGLCNKRDSKDYWEKNYGFHPEVYNIINEKFKNIRILGFDSISVSSFQERMLGREAHKYFLNPNSPILLLEDMDLKNISEETEFKEVIVAPMRIRDCDGLPCTVIGKLYD